MAAIIMGKAVRFIKYCRNRTLEELRIHLYRALGLSFYRFPLRAFFINATSIILGASELILWPEKPRLLGLYFRALGLRSGFLFFMLKYNLLTTRDILWANTIYDSMSPEEFLSVSGLEELKAVVDKGNGVIVLGAHYGPPCYTYALKRHCGLDVGLLVNGDVDRDIKEKAAERKPIIRDRRARFFTHEADYFVAGRNELSLLKHIGRGGAVLMLNDIIAPDSSGEKVMFLDRELPFSKFPFKLALRRNVPVFFCSISNTGGGKYLMELKRAGHFEDGSKGLREYVAFVEGLVRRNPHIWWQSIVTYFSTDHDMR